MPDRQKTGQQDLAVLQIAGSSYQFLSIQHKLSEDDKVCTVYCRVVHYLWSPYVNMCVIVDHKSPTPRAFLKMVMLSWGEYWLLCLPIL